MNMLSHQPTGAAGDFNLPISLFQKDRHVADQQIDVQISKHFAVEIGSRNECEYPIGLA